MSVVTYNGVRMDLVKTNQISVRPVMSTDNTQYLYTEWSHDFVALLNPENTSYTTGGTAQSGLLPAVTIQGIRHKLMQPRRTYSWTIGPDTVISSPSDNVTTDMRNGPMVEDLSVVAIHGIRSWMVRMRITTWINECAEMPVILSHRWRPSIDVDENRYTTRTIVGEVEFNIPRLLELNRNADNYRVNLYHPVPDHFQRTGIKTSVSENGATVHYQFVDEERATNLGRNCPFHDIDVQLSSGITQGSQVNIAPQLLAGATGGIMSSLNASAASPRLRHPLTHIAGAAIGSISSIIDAAIGKVYASCTVTIKGDRLTKPSMMVEAASSIAINRCGAVGFSFPTMTEAQCQINFARKIVVWTQSHVTDGASFISNTQGASVLNQLDRIGQTIRNAFDVRRNPNADSRRPLVNDLLAWLASSNIDKDIEYTHGGIMSDRVVGNPTMKNFGTAGTWVEKLVIQSLLEPCTGPSIGRSIVTYRSASSTQDYSA